MEKRIRRVRRWGDQIVIPISVYDQRDLGIKDGDLVDISKLKKEKEENDSTTNNR